MAINNDHTGCTMILAPADGRRQDKGFIGAAPYNNGILQNMVVVPLGTEWICGTMADVKAIMTQDLDEQAKICENQKSSRLHTPKIVLHLVMHDIVHTIRSVHC